MTAPDPGKQVLLDVSAEFSSAARTAISRLDDLLAQGRLTPSRHAAWTARLRTVVGPEARSGGLRVLDGGRRKAPIR